MAIKDLTGMTLGKYQIVERLGRGGMADVYRAYQPGMDRYVAIKVMHPHLAEDPDFLERFKREAQSVGTLRHPNIVQVIDFDIQDNEYYMVMEFIQGSTLKVVLMERKALPVPEALDLGIKLADAMDYAHKAGMIHRDIKPANVLMSKTGEPILTDFGVAKIVGAKGLTSTGMAVGTPAYMSPEAGRGEKVDERADIYSLGIVLYEMLTGSLPYDADTPFAVIMKHINDPLPPPRRWVPDLPEQVERILLKALTKEREFRHQNAGELRDALTKARQAVAHLPASQTATQPGVTAARPAPPAPAYPITGATKPVSKTDRTPSSARTRTLTMFAAALVVFAVVIIGAVYLFILRPRTQLSDAQRTATAISMVAMAPTNAPTQITSAGAPTQTPVPPTAQPATVASGGNLVPATAVATGKYDKLIAQVREQIRNGQDDRALESVNAALKDDPQSYDLLALQAAVLVQFYRDKERLEAGKAAAEAAIKLAPARPEAYLALGLYYDSDPIDDLDKAVENYTLAIDRGSTEPYAFYWRALANRNRQNVSSDQVIADFTKAISLAPNYDDFYWSRGDYYRNIENLKAAQADYEKSLQIRPDRWKHSQLAAIYIYTDQKQKALDLYVKAIETDKVSDPRYLADGAYVAWAMGGKERERALKWANLALSLAPDTPAASYVRVLLAWDDKKWDEALKFLDQVEKISETDRYNWPFLNYYFDRQVEADHARILVAMGKVDDALPFYDRAIERREDWTRLYIEQAKLYLEKNDKEGARKRLREGLGTTKDDKLRNEILELLAKLGPD